MLKSNFQSFSIGGAVILFLSFFLCVNVNADEFSNIGSGTPGLRIITKPGNSNAIVVYRGLPEAPFGDYIGSKVATNYTIQVIVEHGYDFQKAKAEILSLASDVVPLTLYPFASNSGFTDEVGEEWFWRSSSYRATLRATLSFSEVGYTFTNASLTVFTNVQQVARGKYHLNSDEIFLGFVDNKVFFCKNLFRPAKVYWREWGSQEEYFYRMPRGVLNVYGVMKALHPDKDVGFVVLRKKPYFSNIWVPPNLDDFIEVSFSQGKLVRSEE